METTNSGKEIINKHAVIMYTILAVTITLGNVYQFISKDITIVTLLGVAAFAVIPVTACWIVYLRDNYSDLVRHIIAVGFGIFYAVCCFTGHSRLIFVYAIPLLFVVGMYNDMRFSITVSVICSAVAVFHGVWFTARENWESDSIDNMLIEVLVMIFVALFSILCNKITSKLNEDKVRVINETSEKSGDLLRTIMQTSGEITDEVKVISEKMVELSSSSEETLSSMQEVQAGTTDSAESIQNQLYKTEEIQVQVDKVTEASKNIGDNVVVTVDACHEGRDNMKKLIEQSGVSEKAGNDVLGEVEGLKASTEQMGTIVELIKSIASQTSLLSLNASIEAARAGDAGRGFSVVATEISNLANQTQTATGNITDLIEGLSEKMNVVVEAINSLVESNKVQNESANVTAGSFEKIIESIREIRTNSNNLTGVVETLVKDNNEIVESIQNISAITEEVSAHSTTTCEATEHNKAVVESVQTSIEKMLKLADELKALE
jgi:methyl-accepting chemotaxis protein